MSIKSEIGQWTSASTKELAEIYDRHCGDSAFSSELLALVGNDLLQRGATWLLKRYLENDNQLTKTQVSALYRQLPTVQLWESKLHVLQCLVFMPILQSEKRHVEMFLRSCLEDTNKFVRAWAYNGFHVLALQYPAYENETRQFFEMAMRDEVPSVKSRIRNIMKSSNFKKPL